jgi:hypothetical protein
MVRAAPLRIGSSLDLGDAVQVGGMIVSLHVASGAAAGVLLQSRLGALTAGPVLHLLGDRMPHHDIPSRRFETWTGIGALALVALRHGPLSAATLGAVASSIPDVEHLVWFPQLSGRKLFPSHRVLGWHRTGGVPAWAQLVAAGILLGFVLARR